MLLNKNSIKRWSGLVLMLLLSNGVATYAQNSNSSSKNADAQKQVTVTEQFFKEGEKALADRDRLTAVAAAQAEALTAKDQQIAALRALLSIQESISASWKNAATERKDAIKIDEKIFATYDNRILQLEKERDSARRSRNVWTIAGLALGVFVGSYAKK